MKLWTHFPGHLRHSNMTLYYHNLSIIIKFPQAVSISKWFLCCPSVWGASRTSASSAREGHWCSRSMGYRCLKNLLGVCGRWGTFIGMTEVQSWKTVFSSLNTCTHTWAWHAWLSFAFALNNNAWQAKALILSILTPWGFYHPYRYIRMHSDNIQIGLDQTNLRLYTCIEYVDALRTDTYCLKSLSYFVSDKDPWEIAENSKYWSIRQWADSTFCL